LPVPAVVTACLISSLVTLGPAALVLSDRRNIGGAKPWVLAVFAVLVLHFFSSYATVGVWMVHTDAGGLGLTCLALYFTLRHPVEKSFPGMLLPLPCALRWLFGRSRRLPRFSYCLVCICG
jgi:hypothetical protein